MVSDFNGHCRLPPQANPFSLFGDPPMDVRDAVATRYSCRAFLPTPVPEQTVRAILELAARAPSAGNMQPWHLYALAGEPLAKLKERMAPRMGELPKGEGTDYTIYPH